MKTSRRNFLKSTGLTGAGLLGANLIGCTSRAEPSDPFPHTYRQVFNMRGYGAPKLDVVRVAVIGLGNRGTGSTRRLACIEGVEIRALCDLYADRCERAADLISFLGHKPDHYSGGPDEWKKVCERQDIDLIAVQTPWNLHAEQCVYAMEHDKHAYVELPAATTMDECWQLVETSERTRKHCVQMSGGANAAILNMIRNGFFGELIHAEGGYIHDLIPRHLFRKEFYQGDWRIKENIGRQGNLYPQHGLVPHIQYMDLNGGDRMDYLTSTSSADFSMNEYAKKMAAEDDHWKQYIDSDFRGNMNITVIRTVKGRTIIMQHDVSTPRPREQGMVCGTKAIFHRNRLATDHSNWFSDEEYRETMERYTPDATKRFNELNRIAESVDRGSHGYYRTTPVDWRLIDCLRNGLPVDRDVYEAALSSVITPLSVWSTTNKSNSVSVPDFTCGKWETNTASVDINFERGGGSTRLL